MQKASPLCRPPCLKDGLGWGWGWGSSPPKEDLPGGCKKIAAVTVGRSKKKREETILTVAQEGTSAEKNVCLGISKGGTGGGGVMGERPCSETGAGAGLRFLFKKKERERARKGGDCLLMPPLKNDREGRRSHAWRHGTKKKNAIAAGDKKSREKNAHPGVKIRGAQRVFLEGKTPAEGKKGKEIFCSTGGKGRP